MFFKSMFSCKPSKNYEDNLSLLTKKLELKYNQTKVQNEKQKQKNLKLEEDLYRTQVELNKLKIIEKNKSILKKIKEYFWTSIVSTLIIISIISGGIILFLYYFNYTPNYFPSLTNIGIALPWVTILVILFAFVFNFSFYFVCLIENELSAIKNNQFLLLLIIPTIINIVPVVIDYNFNISLHYVFLIFYLALLFILGICFIKENKLKNSLIYTVYIFIVTAWFYLIVMQYVIQDTNFTDEKTIWLVSFLTYIVWLFIVYLYIEEFSQGKKKFLAYTFLMTMFTTILFGAKIIVTVMRILNIGYYSITELETKYINYNLIHKYVQNNNKKCKQGEPINDTIYELAKDNKSIILSNVNVLSSIGDEYYIQKTCKDKNSTENGFIIKKSDVINRGDIGVFRNKKKDKNSSKK